MRIAIVSNYFTPSIGGIEIQNQLLSDALVRRDHAATVLTRRDDLALPGREIKNGGQIERFRPSGRGVFAKWATNVSVCLHIALRKAPYDAILVTQFSTHILGASFGSVLRSIPLVIRTDQHDECSGAIFDDRLRLFPFGIRQILEWTLRGARAWALRRVDFAIALSKALVREGEAFGGGLTQATACGCPVIASQTGACPDVGGTAPLFADPHNPADFAEKILYVLNNEDFRHKLKKKSLERAAFFSWGRTARLTLEGLTRATTGSRRKR